MLIVNADDWGGWPTATDAARACAEAGRLASATAMVFMADSGRAAELARTTPVDLGLHLNFNQRFNGAGCPANVLRAQDRTRRFLNLNKRAQLFYHPLLRPAFRTVVQAQLAEFEHLYGRSPSHLDGHRHLHLCANVLGGRLLPEGAKVRRSFSFWPGEKSLLNRWYRSRIDICLQQRHAVTDYFFSLAQCLQEDRLARVFSLARDSVVELMTHPEKPSEQGYLLGDAYREIVRCLPPATFALMPARASRTA